MKDLNHVPITDEVIAKRLIRYRVKLTRTPHTLYRVGSTYFVSPYLPGDERASWTVEVVR